MFNSILIKYSIRLKYLKEKKYISRIRLHNFKSFQYDYESKFTKAINFFERVSKNNNIVQNEKTVKQINTVLSEQFSQPDVHFNF